MDRGLGLIVNNITGYDRTATVANSRAVDDAILYPTPWAYQRHRQDNIFHTAPTAGQYGIYCPGADIV